MNTRGILNDRGIALPMALIVMAILSALMAAFAALAVSEPQIASNQLASAQARAMAESGVERALWALTKGESGPGAAGSIANPLPSPVPAPYDGSQFVQVGQAGGGGFVVTVAPGAQANERIVTAVGYVPDNTRPIAVKKIRTVVTRVKWLDPPCAVCAGGEEPPGTLTDIQIGGTANISANNTAGSPPAAYCSGVTPTAAALSTGPIATNGSPSISPPPGGSSLAPNVAASTFSSFLFSDDDIAVLKSLAKARQTYYRGSQTWTSPPPNGLAFVDTPSGARFTNSSPASDQIMVDIHGNWSEGWSGWLIVAGSVQINGNISMSGLVYAQNDITFHGTGTGGISGAMVSTNRKDTSSTNIDTTDIGNAPITYDCPKVRNGGGAVTQNWFLKPGTYQEPSGS